MESIFKGWKANRELIRPDSIEADRMFKAHEGAEVKRILKVAKLTPQFDRA